MESAFSCQVSKFSGLPGINDLLRLIHTSRFVEIDFRTVPDFKQKSTSHIYAEATNNTRHWASRDTTSNGTRIISDLSHDTCSSRTLLRPFPVFEHPKFWRRSYFHRDSALTLRQARPGQSILLVTGPQQQ